MARFGQQLFFDPRYAGPIRVASELGNVGETGKVACTTCHKPDAYFVDGDASSLGAGWTRRNVPGLVDLAYRKAFIWNGKYSSIDAVLELALTSPAALNVTEPDPSPKAPRIEPLPKERRIVDHVRAIYMPSYDPLFPPSANDAEVYTNIALSIAAYEGKLVSGPSPFDRYLAGDAGAIDAAAKRGAKLFIGKALCSECHDGPLFTDDEFHVTGVEQRGDHIAPEDRGRYEATCCKTCQLTCNPEQDDGRFRTPTLRHIAKTGPYMHTGQLETLAQVIEFYRWGGDAGGFAGTKDPRMVPLDLTDDEVRDLEAFLVTLTGEPVDATWTTRPKLPGLP